MHENVLINILSKIDSYINKEEQKNTIEEEEDKSSFVKRWN